MSNEAKLIIETKAPRSIRGIVSLKEIAEILHTNIRLKQGEDGLWCASMDHAWCSEKNYIYHLVGYITCLKKTL